MKGRKVGGEVRGKGGRLAGGWNGRGEGRRRE